MAGLVDEGWWESLLEEFAGVESRSCLTYDWGNKASLVLTGPRHIVLPPPQSRLFLSFHHLASSFSCLPLLFPPAFSHRSPPTRAPSTAPTPVRSWAFSSRRALLTIPSQRPLSAGRSVS